MRFDDEDDFRARWTHDVAAGAAATVGQTNVKSSMISMSSRRWFFPLLRGGGGGGGGPEVCAYNKNNNSDDDDDKVPQVDCAYRASVDVCVCVCVLPHTDRIEMII